MEVWIVWEKTTKLCGWIPIPVMLTIVLCTWLTSVCLYYLLSNQRPPNTIFICVAWSIRTHVSGMQPKSKFRLILLLVYFWSQFLTDFHIEPIKKKLTIWSVISIHTNYTQMPLRGPNRDKVTIVTNIGIFETILVIFNNNINIELLL